MNLQNADIIRDYAEQIPTGLLDTHWARFGKDLDIGSSGSRKTHKGTGIVKLYKFGKTDTEFGHPVILETTIFEQGNLRQKKRDRWHPLHVV